MRRACSSSRRAFHVSLAVVATAALVALGTIQPTGAAAPTAAPSGGTAIVPARGSEVVVKFDPRLGVRLDHTAFTARAGTDSVPLRSIRSVLSAHAANVHRRFVAPEAQLNDTLNSYFHIDALSPAGASALVARLRGTPGVIDAYVAPRAVRAPASPDLTAQQSNYTAPAPHGIGIDAANLSGMRGTGVTVFDLEYSWNKNHEDLTDLLAAGAMIANGTAADPFNDRNHGTAVIGMLDANPNTVGITGLANGSTIRTVNVDNVERGYDLGNAITLATARGLAGDVILIEQQQFDANNNFVPVEYYQEYYDAIKAATAKGLTVVEPAGNGGQSLDAPAYGSTFPFNRSDSGAIIVGAGAPAACIDSGGTAEHGALAASDYGKRVDVQGVGACVTSTGYGSAYANGVNANSDYTTVFGGTSSAAPIVASAAALVVQWGRENHASGPAPNYTLTPQDVRRLLTATGTPQLSGDPRHIGPLPNLSNAFASLLPSAGSIQNQTVASGTPFTLKAPNALPGTLGGALSYQWTQTGGPAATIVNPTNASTTVNGVAGPASLNFQVRVTDPRRQTATSTTTATVANPTSLVADAGPDFPMISGNAALSIPLNSSGSGPGTVTYKWMLLNSTDGKGGSLKNPSAATTSTNDFTPIGNQSYTYRLTVTSGTRTASDDLVVSVRPK